MGSIDRQDSTPQLLNRLRMRQVALMLAIEERRTLRAAATQLGLTQPAATKMLHELESALGQTLFERVGRGLQLNAAGARVTGYFRSIRGSMEALNRELGELKLGSAGKFSVGSIMAASPGRLTNALLGLKAMYPLGPLLGGAGFNITVMSLNGELGIGLISCPDLLPDLWVIADEFPQAR